jgi:hypothetical protein
MAGVVYCITSDDINFKIGRTRKTAKERAKEIGESTLNTFRVLFFIKVNDMQTAEKEAHTILNKYRVRKDREFFNAPLTLIKNIFSQLEEKYPFKELIELEADWFMYHRNIMILQRSFDFIDEMLQSPTYILYKRKKAELDCKIDLIKEGRITNESKLCSDFWNKQSINQDPINPEM